MSRLLTLAIAGAVLASSAALTTATTASPAVAATGDRCTESANGDWSCDYEYRLNWYSCNGIPIARGVRYQVPDGPTPPDGWPVAFLFNGTTPADLNPFDLSPTDRLIGGAFGADYFPQIIHELLDDPAGTGTRYAVIAPEPPQTALAVEFWHTNAVFPYSISCDYDFFPDLFSEIKRGRYGSSSQFDMDNRYGFGISSGGYNTSRMAVTFNHDRAWYQSCSQWCNEDTWQALGVIAASYATCTGPLCWVPNSLPSNHPPTKFWHGTADNIVPISTAIDYHDELVDDGTMTEFTTHGGGHELNSTMLGDTGVKAWFDSVN